LPTPASAALSFIDPHDYISERAEDASKFCIRGKTSLVEIVENGVNVTGYQSEVVRFIYQRPDLLRFRALKRSQQ
jgi:hypothetical protein